MFSPAAMPSPLITNLEPSVLDLFRNNESAKSMHRPIPAPEPNPEPNPGPDASACVGHRSIRPADWDELFKSIQVRLEDCVRDTLLKTPDHQLNDRRVLTQTIVRECVQAMKQLQSALTAERSEHQDEKDLRSPEQG